MEESCSGRNFEQRALGCNPPIRSSKFFLQPLTSLSFSVQRSGTQTRVHAFSVRILAVVVFPGDTVQHHLHSCRRRGAARCDGACDHSGGGRGGGRGVYTAAGSVPPVPTPARGDPLGWDFARHSPAAPAVKPWEAGLAYRLSRAGLFLSPNPSSSREGIPENRQSSGTTYRHRWNSSSPRLQPLESAGRSPRRPEISKSRLRGQQLLRAPPRRQKSVPVPAGVRKTRH